MERLLWFWVWLATSYCRRLYLVVLTGCTYSILPRTAESLSFSFRCREKLFQLTLHKKADFEGGRKVDYLIFVSTHSPARGLTINKGCRNIFPHPLLTIVFYSNSTTTNQFCLEIICCCICLSFDSLICPYYPACIS